MIGTNPLDPNQLAPTEILHTALNLSCQYGIYADFLNEDDIVNEIYKVFTDRCVKRVSNSAEEIGNCLGYWVDETTAELCLTVSDLFVIGDAKCREWSLLFNDMIRLQGISSSRITVVQYTSNGGFTTDLLAQLQGDIETVFDPCNGFWFQNQFPLQTALFVKNYDFNENIKFYASPDSPDEHLTCQNYPITYPFLNGIAAQGVNNEDPPSNFLDHAIVRFNGKYFDASYGSLPFNNKLEYEHGSLDGFGSFIAMEYLNSNNVLVQSILVWLAEKEKEQTLESMINP